MRILSPCAILSACGSWLSPSGAAPCRRARGPRCLSCRPGPRLTPRIALPRDCTAARWPPAFPVLRHRTFRTMMFWRMVAVTFPSSFRLFLPITASKVTARPRGRPFSRTAAGLGQWMTARGSPTSFDGAAADGAGDTTLSFSLTAGLTAGEHIKTL